MTTQETIGKTDLVAAIASEANISQATARQVLDSLTKQLHQALAAGKKVSLPGVGVFKVGQSAARTGRNPRTGEELKIAGGPTPRFSAGAPLKKAVRAQ